MWYLLPMGTRRLDARSSRRRPLACENDDVAFLERVGLLLVALLTRSVQRSCFRPGTRGFAPCGLFSPRSSAYSHSRMDGAFVLERVGLLSVGFPRGPLNVLASLVELMGHLLVAFPRRSDTDMLWSACFELKTTVTEAHKSKRDDLWRAA